MNQSVNQDRAKTPHQNNHTIGGWLFIALVVTLIGTSVAVPHYYQQYRTQISGEKSDTDRLARDVPSLPTLTGPATTETAQRSPQFAEIQPAFTQSSGVEVPPLPPTAEIRVAAVMPPRRNLDVETPQPTIAQQQVAMLPEATPKHMEAQVDDLKRWPQPTKLLGELEELKQTVPGSTQWVTQIEYLLRELHAVQPMTLNSADFLLEELSQAAISGKQAAEQAPFETRQAIRRTVYSLERRLDIWKASLAVLRNDHRLAADSDAIALKTGRNLINFLVKQENGIGWIHLLRLHELEDVVKLNRRAEHVRDVYTSITAANVGRSHREFMAQPMVRDYLVALGGWAEVGRDLPQWLHGLEQVELDPQESKIEALNASVLFWPASPLQNVRELSIAWQKHYRNANVRVAISEQFINRMLPDKEVTSEPIVDQILGARVFGQTHTSSEIGVQLIPDPSRLNLNLLAKGTINSDTQATRGVVTFVSDGVSTFQAQKNIAFDGDTIQTSTTGVAASTQSQLRGMSTDYDDVPLIGNIVRRIALNEHNEQMPRANQIVRGRVASQSQERLDTEIHQRMTAAEAKVNEKLIGPLDGMNLAATPIELETTNQRLIARYRIAGARQWGGYTPRPEAPAASWLSMQLHESLFNNALAGLGLAGKTTTLEELHAKIQDQLGLKSTAPPEDFPEGVSITFADETPAEVRFADGKIQINLNIAELRTENRRWNDFHITVFYAPTTEGLETTFARDGGVFLSGEQRLRLGDRIALSGIFSRAFGRSRPFPIVPEQLRTDSRLNGLTVAPISVDKGWIGIALVPADSTAATTRTPVHAAQAETGLNAPVR